MYLSPLTPKSYAAVNSTLFEITIITGRDISGHARRTTFTLLIFYHKKKHTGSPFTLTRHLFLLFLNMYTHKFKVFTNIVYPVQIIRSEVTIR